MAAELAIESFEGAHRNPPGGGAAHNVTFWGRHLEHNLTLTSSYDTDTAGTHDTSDY
jgi:hypothetical protein